MVLLSRANIRTANSPPEVLWRRAFFHAMTSGDEIAVAYRRGQSPVQVPSFVIDFVLGCEKFRPLEIHIAKHVDKHGWCELQTASLRSWLPQLTGAGLLVSSVQLHAACRKSAGPSPPPQAIEAIGFPTGGDRVEIMRRALDSFRENLQTYGRRAELLIADSSRNSAQRAAFRALAREYSGGVLYAGEEEKRRFAADLARHGDIPLEAIEFMLFDPLDTGFTCGANRNAVLLHGAGRMICSVDDDVVCRLAAPPQSRAEFALYATSDPFYRCVFADRPATLAAAQYVETDFLAMHEAMLGHSLGSLLPDDPTSIDFQRANDEILRRLEESTPRVRTTFTGHFGDPGIPTSTYYLYFDEENLERLTASEAHYRSAFASRNVFTLAAQPSAGDASVSPGMAMGLDHREVLPPFYPVLHAEDFVYGAALWRCRPDAVLGQLPCAILHDPPSGKPIVQPSDLTSGNRAVIFEFAHLMRRLILTHQLAPRASAAERMQALGRGLAEIGRIPHDDFRDFLRVQTLEHESERLGYLERRLRENPDAPEFWRDDVQALIDHSREALAYDDFDIPFDLKAARSPEENRRLMQVLIARFGESLQAWSAMVTAARELREEGRGLFVG
jgi:hypothetical protein